VPPLNEDVVERVDDCPESIGEGKTEMVGASSAGLTVIVLEVPELPA